VPLEAHLTHQEAGVVLTLLAVVLLIGDPRGSSLQDARHRQYVLAEIGHGLSESLAASSRIA
jgi:hypothetical protein